MDQNTIKPSLVQTKVSLATVIIAIFLVAATLAIYWIETEPANQPLMYTIFKKPANPTADWQTYRNEDDRYTVKYPKEWTIREYETGLVIFSAPDQGQVWIGRDEDKKYIDINDYLNQWGYNDPNEAALWNVEGEEFTRINGVDFFKYNWAHQAQGEAYLTIKDGDLVKITFRTGDTIRPLKEFDSYSQFNQILSAFKFIK